MGGDEIKEKFIILLQKHNVKTQGYDVYYWNLLNSFSYFIQGDLLYSEQKIFAIKRICYSKKFTMSTGNINRPRKVILWENLLIREVTVS